MKHFSIHLEFCNRTPTFNNVKDDIEVNNLKYAEHLETQFQQISCIIRKVFKLFWEAIL